MEILEIYSDKKSNERYSEIATDLSSRTRDARVKRYNSTQLAKFQDDVKRVSL